MRVVSGEFAEIDVVLDDGRYLEPFRRFFDLTEGRPSIPIETQLRLMFLKHHDTPDAQHMSGRGPAGRHCRVWEKVRG